MRSVRSTRRVATATALAILAGSALGLGGCTSTAAKREVEHNARRASSQLDIGIDHLQNGRSALALREFMAAEGLDPRNPRIQYALGDAYLARGKREEAEQHYLRALELHPDYHDAMLSLSALYIVNGRYEESIALCAALVDDPTFETPWRALANLGWSELQLGRLDAARRNLELAREFNTGYWPAMLTLAELEAKQGRRREAILLLEEVIALGPGAAAESQANYQLAEQYIALGRRDRAVGHLTTAVARAPEGEWARRSEEYLKLLR